MVRRVYAQQPVAAASLDPARSDEDLMYDLASGRQDALGPLYGRYASLVFQLGVQSLERSAAEELVQEVFLTIWRGADSFDASQGAFRPWLLRLTHWKILNELRRRRRRPATRTQTPGEDDDLDPLQDLPDVEPGPEDRAWQTEHADIVKSALAELPPKQRQAIALAFLEDMTHEQVARTLDVPLGTAKTRIRSGLQILRTHLAPMAASLLAVGLGVVGFRLIQTQAAADRQARAIALVTTSELTPLRLTPVSADVAPAEAHANYRGRDGNNVAVLSTEFLPTPPSGKTYQAWARHGDTWTSLGTFTTNADGTAQLIAEDPALSTPPDAVLITLEPSGGSHAPTGQPVLAWA
ncbi:MAG: sigma-70 family RNA polymerase sigma factor, partial [Chloroflexi bacterium]|nr:sigma-70 family RNA polymerase sigma factor [Chloroflexota bacterium]